MTSRRVEVFLPQPDTGRTLEVTHKCIYHIGFSELYSIDGGKDSESEGFRNLMGSHLIGRPMSLTS